MAAMAMAWMQMDAMRQGRPTDGEIGAAVSVTPTMNRNDGQSLLYKSYRFCPLYHHSERSGS